MNSENDRRLAASSIDERAHLLNLAEIPTSTDHTALQPVRLSAEAITYNCKAATGGLTAASQSINTLACTCVWNNTPSSTPNKCKLWPGAGKRARKRAITSSTALALLTKSNKLAGLTSKVRAGIILKIFHDRVEQSNTNFYHGTESRQCGSTKRAYAHSTPDALSIKTEIG